MPGAYPNSHTAPSLQPRAPQTVDENNDASIIHPGFCNIVICGTGRVLAPGFGRAYAIAAAAA